MSSAAEVVAFKLTAALELLRADKIAFDTTHEMLCKVVENIVKAPAEPKYRKLRTTNEKINALLLAPASCSWAAGLLRTASFSCYLRRQPSSRWRQP